jgi:hypothetical protein
MGQRLKDAPLKDAQTMLSKEEFALSMGQHGQGNDAAVMDAQIKLRKEECAGGMVQKANDAASKGAQMKLSREACVRHGAKKKLCNSEGCTNQAKKGGVCMKHGRNPNDESTAFAFSASAFERTTATLPHYRAPEAFASQATGNIPDVVTIVWGCCNCNCHFF